MSFEYVNFHSMRNKFHFSIILLTAITAGLLFIVTSCKKDPVVPTVSTSQVTEITANTAKSGGTIVSDGGEEITQMGICWAETAGPSITDFITSDGRNPGSASFTSTITGLQPGITYYVRAYAKNSIGVSYGEEISFQTPALTPTVTTAAISEITLNSARSGGNVTNTGGAPVTAKGVCWSTSASPTTDGSCTNDGAGTGIFTSNINELTSGQKYYVRAYATNSAGTGYGEELSFTTDQVLLPTVTTSEITSVGVTAAVTGGNVTYDGGGDILERGVCYNTSGDPDISDSKKTESGTTGTFVSSLTNLSAGTIYYVRAYARNSSGIAYGNERIFSTSASDVDGNIYPTVIIGSQLWMQKDLKTTRFNDNTAIDNVTDNLTWAGLSTPAYSWYDNQPSYGSTYGIIYNWHAVGTGKLCPLGWHVPTDDDFKDLERHLGMTEEQVNATLWRGTDQGTQLKSTSTWIDNGNGTNASGWTALAGGYRYGVDGGFVGLGYNTYWWSSSEHWSDTTKGLYRRLRSEETGVFREGVSKAGGKMVRCIRD